MNVDVNFVYKMNICFRFYFVYPFFSLFLHFIRLLILRLCFRLALLVLIESDVYNLDHLFIVELT